MSGLTAMPAYRRFVNDLRDPRCIPAVDAPRSSLWKPSGLGSWQRWRKPSATAAATSDEASYIKQRARVLREGTELPPEPSTAAERKQAAEQHRRNVATAQAALLDFADVVCRTVEAHPEWRDEARAKVQAARAEADADAAMAQAQAAARRAEEAAWFVQHMERAAADELYPAASSTVPRDEPDLAAVPQAAVTCQSTRHGRHSAG